MHFLKRPVHVVEESIGMATNYRGWFANNQMKIFFSHNDRKDKVSGPTEKDEKDEKKEGEKELIFLKVSPDPAAGRFALEFASSR